MKLPVIISSEKKDDGETILRLVLDKDMDVFAGHFPGAPILPGVVQIDWALRLAGVHLNIDVPVARRFQVKFREIIRPNDNLSVSLKYDQSRRKLLFSYLLDKSVASSGSITWDAA